MQFFGARCNLAKALLYSINQGCDEKEGTKVLNKVADIIDANKEELALIESADNGKPLRETRVIDIPYASAHFRYFAGVILAEEGSAQVLDNAFLSIILREPIGVVGQIVPWNFPFLMAAWKLAPVLAAGDCTVIKPSSSTPLSVLRLAELTSEVIPPGVFNVVTGKGSKAGNYMLEHEGFAKLAFTGSTEIGRDVALAAAKRLIPSTLELGGKSANIIFDDCRFNQALDGALQFANMQILGYAEAHPELKGMGTTACIVLLGETEAYIAHVGDSRIYLYLGEEKQLHRLTKDHSYVQALVDAGQITEEEAEHHPNKNRILKALGVTPKLIPSYDKVLPKNGDVFLICSDGLSGMLSDKTMENVLSDDISIAEKGDKLISLALEAGGLDNITLELVRISSSPNRKSVFQGYTHIEKRKKTAFFFLIVV